MDTKKRKIIIWLSIAFFLIVSIFAYTIVKADEYSNKIAVNRAKITSIVTGSDSFDESDGLVDNTSIENYIAGSDSNGDNRIVRSFDTLTYNFKFMLTGKEGDINFSERTVDIDVELTEEEAKYVVFEENGIPGERKYTYHFEEIDSYSEFDKSVTLYILGAPNGTSINPKFVIKESTDEDAGISLGKVSSEDNYYSYEDNNYSDQASFQNILPIVVSSKPANIKVDTLTTDENQKSTYDGKIGRFITFVSGIYIEGDSNKGIKGLDMPTGDISFNISASQEGSNSAITADNWARLYSSSGINEINPVVLDLPYSTNDSGSIEKVVQAPGSFVTTRNNNDYSVIVSDYKIGNVFPTKSASDSEINNKYFIGTYSFTVFSPRTVEDMKNAIPVNFSMNSININGTNGETYAVDNSNVTGYNEYYQVSDHSYESAFYTENDKKLNSEDNIGSISKGSNIIYKTVFNYKKTLSNDGLKEVVKVNPYAFRVMNYNDEDIVDIEVKCGDEKCSNISKDDFEIKLISGDFNNSNYSLISISDKIDEEDKETLSNSCANLNLSEYNSDQILNLYGGPCIAANEGYENIYSKISDAVNTDGTEDKITKVVISTKEGIFLPDNATVTIKTKLRVRNVPDLTRLYQVASVISTSDYDMEKRYYYPSPIETTNPDNYRLPVISGTRVIDINNVSYADSVRIANYTSRQEISVLNKNKDGSMKTSYNTADNEIIEFSIKPYVEDHSENVGADDTWFIKYIGVEVELPKDLEFISDGNNSKYLVDVERFEDYTYLYFELPFTKPNMSIDNVTFKTKINSKVKGNEVPLTIRSGMYAYNINSERDSSLFGDSLESFTIHANGEENVIVEQRVGSAGTLVEKDSEFSYLLTVYNNTNDAITDYKIIDVLPFNGDTNGTNINGTYETKINVPESLSGAKIYCSTQEYSDLREDIEDIGNEWEECPDLKDNYKVITAVKITDISIQPDSYIEPIELIIKPHNNNYSDTYNNDFVGGSDNHEMSTSNVINVGVVSRSISGKVFYDINENGYQDEKDTYTSGIPVSLYKIEEGEEEKVAETVTDSNGKYIFDDLDIGAYYIDLSYNGSQYDLTRRYASLDEKIDSDAYKVSDTIARISNKKIPDDPFGIRVTRENISLENYDMGLIPRRSFGFDLKKYITRIDLNYNGTTNTTNYNNESKVLLSVRNSLRATARVYYGIAITNDSTRAGYVNEIEENIPDGLIFDSSIEENQDWIMVNGKLISNALSDTVIYPGETKYLQIVLFMPTRESASTFLNTVSIVEMSEYEPETIVDDSTYSNTHGYVVGEKVDYAGISWHVIDTVNNDDGSQNVTLLADSGTITMNYSHSYGDTVYKWSDSEINLFINRLWENSLDKSVLFDTPICDDASGLEVASYGGSVSGICQSNIFTSSKIRLLTSEEYTRLITSHLSNIEWLTGNNDYWLQSSDDTRPVYNMFGTEPSDSYGDISTSSYNKASYVSTNGIKTDLISNTKEIRPVITLSSNNILFE